MRLFRYTVLMVFVLFQISLFGQQGGGGIELEGIDLSKIPLTGGEKYDVILSRNLLIPIKADTIAGIDAARSGSLTLGLGFTFNVNSRWGIRIEPRVNWNKLTFSRNLNRYFPDNPDSTDYSLEKFRMFYAELPLTVKWNLLRSEDEKLRVFLETGGIIGYYLGGTFKTKFEEPNFDDPSQTHNVVNKSKHLPAIYPLRYGPFLRVGYRWVALNVFYRLNEVFKKDATYENHILGTQSYPTFSPLEIGISIVF